MAQYLLQCAIPLVECLAFSYQNDTVLTMLSIFKRNKGQTDGEKPTAKLTWQQEATDALEQAVSGAPVPKLMKSRLRKELMKTAEAKARAAGKAEVSAHDLMEGLMSKLPAEMKNQIQQAAQRGPKGLEELQKKFQKKGK